MPNIVFSKSGSRIFARSGTGSDMQPGKRREANRGVARVLAGLCVCAALIGGWAAVSAPEPAGQALPAAAGRSHDPLAGKACVDCHDHAVPSNGRCLLAGKQMCVLCHEIPAAGGQARLVEPSAPLCFRCHAKDAFQGGFVHGPIAAGSCITCHAPHGSGNSGMLRVAGPKLCLACHKDMDVRLINAGFSHKAAVNDCIDCHSPHASEQRYQLRKAVPGLCEGCHENIFRDLKEAVIHSPVTEEPACLNCHDPHMAENEWLLPADDMGACLKCHNEPVKAGQSELAPMGPLLAANPRHHGPIQSRECSECHNPHGSSYFRLLTAAYPQRLYAPFFESNYALCFRCHESTLVTEEHTETLTGFRDGDRNLHFVHVKNPSLGRTCRLCHETHASSQPEYIRASVPFGTWNLPIKFKKTENGGSCEPGCHAAQTYAYQTTQPGRP